MKNTSMQFFLSQQQQQEQEQQQQSSIKCYQCALSIPENIEWGYMHIDMEGNIVYFCSTHCRHQYRITRTCAQCLSKFQSPHIDQRFCSKSCHSEYTKIPCHCCGKMVKGRMVRGVQMKRFCSIKCYRSVSRRKRYEDYNLCENCNKWIPKKESIFKPKGTKKFDNNYSTKKDNYYCPHCNYRLVTKNPMYSKNRIVKRID